MTSKPSFPCIANPYPQSALQSGIHCRRTTFYARNVPTSFPYETQHNTVTDAVQIYHLIFDGQGPPPDDIGDPGDIYFDHLNSDILHFQKLVLYARMDHSWKQWYGRDINNLLQHPYLPKYFLWQDKDHFAWTYAINIEGWTSNATEVAKREKAAAMAKTDREKFQVEVAPDGLSLSVNLPIAEADNLRSFLDNRKRAGEDADMGPRKKSKLSATAASFSELVEAMMHDAETLYTENEQLREEVGRLKEIIMLHDKTVRLGQGLAEENATLQRTCHVLVEENAQFKDVAQVLREKLQRQEDEIVLLKEKHHALEKRKHDVSQHFRISSSIARSNSSNTLVSSKPLPEISEAKTSKSRSRSMTLPAPLTSDSEKESLKSHEMITTQTPKKEVEDLDHESLAVNLPSLHTHSEEPTKAAGTVDEPIDLTMDESELEENLESLTAAPEDLSLGRVSSGESASVLPESSRVRHLTDADRTDGDERRTDSGLTKQKDETAVEMAFGICSGPPADDITAGKSGDVKVERSDNDFLLSQSPIQSPSGSNFLWLDIIFHTEVSAMFCRLCVMRLEKNPSPGLRVSFPVNTPHRKLFDHCETEHPVEAQKFALMAPETLAMIRAQMPGVE